jgi:diguanylate cyclase
MHPGWYDELTGLPGPAFWQTVLRAESSRCTRYGRSATVVLAEIVGFDDVTVMRGRDLALQSDVDVGAVLRSGCRISVYVTRLADARFGILLTESDQIAAINVVERLRDQCDQVVRARAVGARAAFGWASPTGSLSLLDAVERAEDSLRHEAGAV